MVCASVCVLGMGVCVVDASVCVLGTGVCVVGASVCVFGRVVCLGVCLLFGYGMNGLT